MIFVIEISPQFALVRPGDGSYVVAVRSKEQHYHFPIVFPLPWTSHNVTWHFLSVFKAQTKVSEEQTQGPLCNLLSSCIEQNVLLVCSLPVMEKKSEHYWKRAIKKKKFLSIPIYDNNNSYPVQRYTRYELVLL